MFLRTAFLTTALVVLPSLGLANPVGNYGVVGTNPGTGQEYTGDVSVERNGETYLVYWKIAGTEFIGTGLGAKFVGDRFEMGPASSDDTAISVGYVSDSSFGMAMFFKQPDGHWQGVWTYSGSGKVAAENWYQK